MTKWNSFKCFPVESTVIVEGDRGIQVPSPFRIAPYFFTCSLNSSQMQILFPILVRTDFVIYVVHDGKLLSRKDSNLGCRLI